MLRDKFEVLHPILMVKIVTRFFKNELILKFNNLVECEGEDEFQLIAPFLHGYSLQFDRAGDGYEHTDKTSWFL